MAWLSLRPRWLSAIAVTAVTAVVGVECGGGDSGDDHRLATLVARLQRGEAEESDRLFENAIAAVADQGAVPDDLVHDLSIAARRHINGLARRANDAVAPMPGEDAVPRLCDAHEFTEILMRDKTGSASVYAGMLEYARERFESDTGDGLGQETRSIAGLAGLVIRADESAGGDTGAARADAQQRFLAGFVLLEATLAPPHGRNLSTELDQTLHDFTGEGANGETAHITAFKASIRAQISSALAAYEYGVRETWTAAEVADATIEALDEQDGVDADFLVDATIDDRRPIKVRRDMSDDEAIAYEAWVNSDLVVDQIIADRTAAGRQLDAVADAIGRC